MELASQEPGMAGDLDDLHEILVWRYTGNDQTMLGEDLFELTIEFVSMPMTFGNHG
jgi:hypothetical protein